jgi:rhodanese-related sulfurtransferase
MVYRDRFMPADPQPIGVREAHAVLQQEEGAVYLDVRTEEEFEQGHPERAINIPIGLANPATRMLEGNPDFARVAKAVLPVATPILVGCHTGPRAVAAAQILARDGYTNVRWVQGGWAGITDPFGRSIAPGWLDEGLPTSAGPVDGAYREQRRKAGLR